MNEREEVDEKKWTRNRDEDEGIISRFIKWNKIKNRNANAAILYGCESGFDGCEWERACAFVPICNKVSLKHKCLTFFAANAHASRSDWETEKRCENTKWQKRRERVQLKWKREKKKMSMKIICARKDGTVYEINPVIYVFQQTTRRTSIQHREMLAQRRKNPENGNVRKCSKAVETSCCAFGELIIMKANHRVHYAHQLNQRVQSKWMSWIGGRACVSVSASCIFGWNYTKLWLRLGNFLQEWIQRIGCGCSVHARRLETWALPSQPLRYRAKRNGESNAKERKKTQRAQDKSAVLASMEIFLIITFFLLRQREREEKSKRQCCEFENSNLARMPCAF